VLGNPLRYIDPSGRTPVCGFSYSDPECKDVQRRLPLDPPQPPTPPGPPNAPPVSSGDYVFPIPENLKSILEENGAAPEVLNNAIINMNQDDLHWQFSCKGFWNTRTVARTDHNTIYWCMPDYFDYVKPSEYLVHELVHVAQFNKYPDDVNEEQWSTLGFYLRDLVMSSVTDSWKSYDPYKYSWIEVSAANCQRSYRNNDLVALDQPPCNIWVNYP
jgi:hypothetical protein